MSPLSPSRRSAEGRENVRVVPDIAHTGAGPLQRSTMTLEGPAYSPRPRELPETGVGLLYSVPATRQGAPSWKNVATNSLSPRTARRKGGAGPPRGHRETPRGHTPLIGGAPRGGGAAYTDSTAFAIKVTSADGTLERVPRKTVRARTC